MENRHFVAIIAGDNPEKLIAKYDENLPCEQQVVGFIDKAAFYRAQWIDICRKFADNDDIGEMGKELYKERLEFLLDDNNDDIDCFIEIFGEYEIDENTGNAVTNRNMDGKYAVAQLASHFAYPFLLKDGSNSFSAKKGDIDWDTIQTHNYHNYELAWEFAVEGKKPNGEHEETIYNNVKNHKNYFLNYGDKETYVKSNTCFFGYAFVDSEGWFDIDDSNMAQMDWVINFYDTFIKNLPDDTLLSIYECVRS